MYGKPNARGNENDGISDCPVCVVLSVCMVHYPGFLPAPILTIVPNTTVVRGVPIMTALQATLDCAIVPVFDVWVENSYRRVNADCAGYNGLLFLVGCKIG